MTVRVVAIGDSVMQGAGPELYGTLPAILPGIDVDAEPSRQLAAAPALVAAKRRADPPPEVVVVHLGTNGLFGDAVLDELVAVAGTDTPVLLVTVKAPRGWEAEVNRRLRAGIARAGPPTSLVDWWSCATRAPEYLRADGFHLTPDGAIAYAELLASAVDSVTPPRH
jgi:lysophospholipase L1-like esterase